MEQIVMQGGHPLSGRVRVSGSKNASLPIMAACLLADGVIEVENVPDVRDIRTMAQMLELLGAKAEFQAHHLRIDPTGFASRPAPYELVSTMRASIYVLAPLLSRFGQAQVALPGGCAIGLRPIDQHLKGLEALGAQIHIEHGDVVARAPQGLRGAEIHLDVVSVGATVNILLAAVLAPGRTVLHQAASEPDIIGLADFLNAMGAKVRGAGTPRIEVEGVKHLVPAPVRVMPDRIEAGTLAIAVAITAGDAVLEEFPSEHLEPLAAKLRSAGVELAPGDQARSVRVRRSGGPLQAVDITTQPYPGFPTDLQAQWTALMCLAQGRSKVTETVWENRFMHVAELNRMGAEIRIDGNSALVQGVEHLTGARVMASDLRASAALILAGLMAEGETTVSRIYHLDRGYEHLERKLTALGATIRRERE